MDKKLIVLITDSLGMPRKEILFDQTWVGRLVQYSSADLLIHTIPFSVRGLTIRQAVKIVDEVALNYRPNAVIVQVGIVDAARRAMPLWLRLFIDHLPGIRTVVRYIVSRFHKSLTRHLNIHYADIRSFSRSASRMTKSVGCPIAYIQIAPPGHIMKCKTYGIAQDVINYNRVLEKVAHRFSKHYLTPFDNEAVENVVLPNDGHHLSIYGHEKAFEEVTRWLRTVL